MRLTNGDRADLGHKLETYVLNSEHIDGKHKARVFAATLGITTETSELLRAALLTIAAHSDQAVSVGHILHGELFELRFTVEVDGRSANVLSGWIVLRDEDFPRLTTCYIVS